MKRIKKYRSIVLTLGALALIAGMVFNGCSPTITDGGGTAPSGNDDPNPTVAWSLAADCVSCHAKEAGTMTSAGYLANTHSTGGVKCADCHKDESVLKTVHEGKTADSKKPKFLKKTEVGEATCLSSACHDTTMEKLTELTAGCTIFTDSNGTTVNPHTVIGLNKDHQDGLECASCHAMHTDGYGETNTFQQVCLDCHHQDVYECHTCH